MINNIHIWVEGHSWRWWLREQLNFGSIRVESILVHYWSICTLEWCCNSFLVHNKCRKIHCYIVYILPVWVCSWCTRNTVGCSRCCSCSRQIINRIVTIWCATCYCESSSARIGISICGKSKSWIALTCDRYGLMWVADLVWWTCRASQISRI